MRRNHLFALALLPSVLTVTACKTDQPALPDVQFQTVYPPMPPTKCARLPKVPAVDATDNDWAAYKKDRDNSGDDCRDKLDAVDAVVSKWPAAPQAQAQGDANAAH